MTPRLVLWALTSALAGFLFGFDTVVISGAEQTIQQLWNLSDSLHGLTMGSALWGTVVGAMIGGRPADRFGRRSTLVGLGVLYVVSALGSGFAPEVYTLMLARLIGGLAIGVSTVAAPLYISEIAPPKHRGLLTGLFQLGIVFGILIAFLSNRLLADVGEQAWRWMLGVEAIPALCYTLMCVLIPESPRWLLTRGQDRAAGLRVLHLANPELSAEQVEQLARDIEIAAQSEAATAGFWSAPLRQPILLAFLIAVFNQLSGINAVLYFAPRIFELTGLGAKAALLESVGIGITNFVMTLVGLWLIDRLGRRTLLIIGSLGYIVSLGACSWAFATETYGIVPACIFAFVASHAVGQGAVIWVFISEIFPTRFRASGQALGSSTHWVFAAAITTVFPWVVSHFSPQDIFAFFSGMMVLQLLWVLTMVPETKGVPLEAMQQRLRAE